MSDLITIARRFLGTGSGEKGDKGEKPPTTPFSPLSPFSHPHGGQEPDPPLVGAEPCDQRVALRLIADADALLERLGVDGQHPAVASAAAMVTSAHATRDLETLRFAVAEFTVVVRRLAGMRG